MAIKSLYFHAEVCVRVNGKQSKQFHTGFGLWQDCVLSHLLFIVYMKWMDKLNRTDECVVIGRCKITWLLLADDLVWLYFSKFGLLKTHYMALQLHVTLLE